VRKVGGQGLGLGLIGADSVAAVERGMRLEASDETSGLRAQSMPPAPSIEVAATKSNSSSASPKFESRSTITF